MNSFICQEEKIINTSFHCIHEEFSKREKGIMFPLLKALKAYLSENEEKEETLELIQKKYYAGSVTPDRIEKIFLFNSKEVALELIHKI